MNGRVTEHFHEKRGKVGQVVSGAMIPFECVYNGIRVASLH
jgi:hypothetical protein